MQLAEIVTGVPSELHPGLDARGLLFICTRSDVRAEEPLFLGGLFVNFSEALCHCYSGAKQHSLLGEQREI